MQVLFCSLNYQANTQMTDPDGDIKPETIGVLLTNLGTPDSTKTGDVRRYLKEFLSDPRVVTVPRLAWWLVLNLVILNTRPRQSAKAYEKIWTDQGSPLLSISQQQADLIREQLQQGGSAQIKLALAMRYGNPSIANGLAELREQGANKILVLPLYPQYSATTTASTFDAVSAALRCDSDMPELRFINRYAGHPQYLQSLVQSVRDHWAEHPPADRLLMSFHGLPQEYVDAGDPYQAECQQTAEALAQALELSDDQWQQTFQSRMGPKAWLQPYTDKTLEVLAQSGVKSVQIMCPGFSADCLETLEEIQMQNRDVFLAAGGERYEYIPCLNTRPDHIEMLVSLLRQHMAGWGAY